MGKKGLSFDEKRAKLLVYMEQKNQVMTLKELEKELAAARQALITGGSSDTDDDVIEVDGVKILAARVDGADAKTLRDAVDRYKDKLQTAVVVIWASSGWPCRERVGFAVWPALAPRPSPKTFHRVHGMKCN